MKQVQKLRQVLQCSWQCLSASAQNQYLKNNKQNINELMEVDGHIILHPYNFIKSNPAGSLLTGSVASATFLWSAARYGSCEFDTGEHSLGNLHIQWVQSLNFQHLLRVIKLSQPAGLWKPLIEHRETWCPKAPSLAYICNAYGGLWPNKRDTAPLEEKRAEQVTGWHQHAPTIFSHHKNLRKTPPMLEESDSW